MPETFHRSVDWEGVRPVRYRVPGDLVGTGGWVDVYVADHADYAVALVEDERLHWEAEHAALVRSILTIENIVRESCRAALEVPGGVDERGRG